MSSWVRVCIYTGVGSGWDGVGGCTLCFFLLGYEVRKLEVKRNATRHEKILTAFGFAYKDTVFTKLYR